MHAQKIEKPDATQEAASGLTLVWCLGFGFGLQHFATAVETGGADVMTQVDFAGCGLDSDTRHYQCVV
jgi:hypothetical protein